MDEESENKNQKETDKKTTKAAVDATVVAAAPKVDALNAVAPVAPARKLRSRPKSMAVLEEKREEVGSVETGNGVKKFMWTNWAFNNKKAETPAKDIQKVNQI
jgi:hypothetical protein